MKIATLVTGRWDLGLLKPVIECTKSKVITMRLEDPYSDAYGRIPNLRLQLHGLDWLILLGDRVETLCAALAARHEGVKICHVAGGEATARLDGENIIMDSDYRWLITQLADLHLPCSKEAHANIVEQKCLWSGIAIEIEGLFMPLVRRIKKRYSAKKDHCIVIYHGHPLDDVLAAIGTWPDALVFSSNPDHYIDPKIKYTPDLDHWSFLKLLREAKFIIGNSSAGIFEAPALETPTVNIGSRQVGRIASPSIFNAAPDFDSIKKAIEKAMQPCEFVNVYASGKKITDVLPAALW